MRAVIHKNKNLRGAVIAASCVAMLIVFVISFFLEQPLTRAEVEAALAKHPATVQELLTLLESETSDTSRIKRLGDYGYTRDQLSIERFLEIHEQANPNVRESICWFDETPSYEKVQKIVEVPTSSIAKMYWQAGGGPSSYHLLIGKDSKLLGYIPP